LNHRRLVLAINGYGLAPLGYWLCLAWSRLGLVINPLRLGYGRLATGCAWLGAAWAWLLIRLGLAMAAWAWLGAAWLWRLWLGAAWLLAVLGLVPLGYWLRLAWRQLGLAINLLGLGYGCAWLGAAWA